MTVLSKETKSVEEFEDGFCNVEVKVDIRCRLEEFVDVIYLIETEDNFDIKELVMLNRDKGDVEVILQVASFYRQQKNG
jgi:hypothetical protein